MESYLLVIDQTANPAINAKVYVFGSVYDDLVERAASEVSNTVPCSIYTLTSEITPGPPLVADVEVATDGSVIVAQPKPAQTVKP